MNQTKLVLSAHDDKRWINPFSCHSTLAWGHHDIDRLNTNYSIQLQRADCHPSTSGGANATTAQEIFRIAQVFNPVALDKLKNVPKGIPLNLQFVRHMMMAYGEGISAEVEHPTTHAALCPAHT